MYHLMRRVKYTSSNAASNKWHSEFGFTCNRIPEGSVATEEKLPQIQEDFPVEPACVKENGFRARIEWWNTTHNSTYDR